MIAGRYDPGEIADTGERVPGYSVEFAPPCSVSLAPFSAAESRQYLVEKRHLPADDPRLAVASERAGGSPFALALYADLLHTRPDLPVDELRTYPSADLAYLIERVLERIPDPYVHWLLRYGVVPRRLTWTYVKDVMAKRLKEATSGVETYDKSNNDPLPEHKKQTLFRRDLLRPGEPLKALDEIWKNLTQYASQSSWVSRVDNDPNILLFHPEVLNPMRWLLREHQRDAFRLLHADAVR